MSHDELAEKARFWTTETVNARLASAFGDDERPAASLLLTGLVGEVPEGAEEDSLEASCRLMLGALKLSEGDLYRLRLWVEAAQSDPRDLIAAAEYRRELESATPEARDADLLEYAHWASGETP